MGDGFPGLACRWVRPVPAWEVKAVYLFHSFHLLYLIKRPPKRKLRGSAVRSSDIRTGPDRNGWAHFGQGTSTWKTSALPIGEPRGRKLDHVAQITGGNIRRGVAQQRQRHRRPRASPSLVWCVGTAPRNRLTSPFFASVRRGRAGRRIKDQHHGTSKG